MASFLAKNAQTTLCLKGCTICLQGDRRVKVGSMPGEGGGLNLDQTGMCHWCLKFITLFWSGKTQKGNPALELSLLP